VWKQWTDGVVLGAALVTFSSGLALLLAFHVGSVGSGCFPPETVGLSRLAWQNMPTCTDLRVVTLWFGHKLARRRRWSTGTTLTLATLVGTACGTATVALHSGLTGQPGRALTASTAAGLGVPVFCDGFATSKPATAFTALSLEVRTIRAQAGQFYRSALESLSPCFDRISGKKNISNSWLHWATPCATCWRTRER
jgi:hypothetical protein